MICSNKLDLIVGFSGQETLPHDVQPFVNGLVERITTQGMVEGKVWKTLEDMLVAYPATLRQNSVVALYWKAPGEIGPDVVTQEVGAHRVERPLGYNFKHCGRPLCPAKEVPGHVTGELLDGRFRITCRACMWKSKWRNLAEVESQLGFKRLNKNLAPLIFYHQFPLSSSRLGACFE